MNGTLISTWLPPLLVAGVAALLVWRFLHRQPRPPEPRRDRASNPYHCVAIDFRKGACAASQSLNRQRLLSHEAPLLPLPGCDAKLCRCTYLHYDDRRQDDRRHPLGLQRGVLTNRGLEDRRSGSDRRREPQWQTQYSR